LNHPQTRQSPDKAGKLCSAFCSEEEEIQTSGGLFHNAPSVGTWIKVKNPNAPAVKRGAEEARQNKKAALMRDEARRIAVNVAKAAVKEGSGNQPGLLS